MVRPPRAFWTMGVVGALAGCVSQETISYTRDVYPLLRSNCLKCHMPPDGEGYGETSLSVESYESLIGVPSTGR